MSERRADDQARCDGSISASDGRRDGGATLEALALKSEHLRSPAMAGHRKLPVAPPIRVARQQDAGGT